MSSDGRRVGEAVGLPLVLVVWTVATFSAVVGHDFVNYDDLDLVVRNPHVTADPTLGNLASHFWRPYKGNWLPIQWISLQLGHALHGPHAPAFLITNVLVHALSTGLLYAALRRMTGSTWRSAFVAIVFGVHPLHVESVAWVSQRKDVLGGLFWMLGLYAYARYVERPGWNGRYALVVACLVVGLLSKATLVVFPFVLLLLDYWPLGRLQTRLRRAIVEKIPMVALTLAVSAVTYFVQRAVGNMRIGYEVGPIGRVVNVVESYWLYLRDALWPSRLAAMYPHPFMVEPAEPIDAAGATILATGLAGVTALAYRARGRHPHLLVGWLWYLGVLVPMIGIVHVGLQARADRYMYLPLIGLAIGLAWAAGDLVTRRKALRTPVVGAALALVVAMTATTRTQIEYWTDSITLFQRIVAVTEDNRFGHEKLAVFLGGAGRHAEAAAHFEEALRIEPDRTTSRFGLATMLERMGEDEGAIEQYRKGLEIHPRKVRAHGRLGVLLARGGRPAEAETHLRYALRVLPEEADYQRAMGDATAALGRPDEARAHYEEAVRLRPDDAEAAAALARLERQRDGGAGGPDGGAGSRP